MKTVSLRSDTEIFCLTRPEARALDAHIDGYFRHGIDVKPGDVVFDVGANIGLFDVRITQRTDGKAKVFAFEPVPAIRAVLEANAARHGRGAVRVLPWALASAPGEMDIAYYPRSPSLSTTRPEVWGGDGELLTDTVLGGAGGWGKVMPRFTARWIARWLRARVEHTTCRVRTVPEVRRELALERIDLLKIDVEGAELEVLRGIGDDAAEWARIGSLVIEVHDVDGALDAARTLLASHGFDRITAEAEAGFENTALRNLYATRL